MNKFQSFKHYYEDTVREYHYRIKTIVELDDDLMGRLEHVLKKYDLKDIETPKKTMMQCSPLDFKNVAHGEVWIIDIVTGMPVSAFILREELRIALGINEDNLIVRGENDPQEVEDEKGHALWQISDEAKGKGLVPGSLLSTESTYNDGEQTPDGKTMYGDEYNSKLTDYLASVSKTRKEMEIKPSAPLFDFVTTEKPETGSDFNADIPNSPKIKNWWEALETVEMANDHISHTGNFDSDKTKYSRVYTDKNSKKVELSADANGLRKGK